MRGPHDGANIDCTAENIDGRITSLPGKSDGKREKEKGIEREREMMIGREEERTGNRDSTRSIPGLRVRLVKSFAGIMNPPRVVIPTFVLANVTTRRLFAATKTKGVGAS